MTPVKHYHTVTVVVVNFKALLLRRWNSNAQSIAVVSSECKHMPKIELFDD